MFHLISRTKKNSRGTILCLKIFLVSKQFMDKRGWGSTFSVRNVVSRSAELNRTGIFQCVTESGIENFLH